MPELITLCTGCGHKLDYDDLQHWKKGGYGEKEGRCMMCWALGTPDEFLDSLLSPEEKIMYNKCIKEVI